MLEPLLASADCRTAGLVCLCEVAQWEATSAMDPGEGRQPCKPFLSHLEPTLREQIGIECILGGNFQRPQKFTQNPETPKTIPRLRELFQKVRANFGLLPCDVSQEANGPCSDELFFFWGGGVWIFLL